MMLVRAIILSCCVIGLILCVISCEGGGTVGSKGRLYQGKVQDPNMKALPRVVVTVDNASTETDEGGNFSLETEPESFVFAVITFEFDGKLAQTRIDFEQETPEFSIVELKAVFDETTSTATVDDVKVTDARPSTPTPVSEPTAIQPGPVSSASSSSTNSETSSSVAPPPPASSSMVPTVVPTQTSEPTQTAQLTPTQTVAPTATATPIPEVCRADVDGDGTVELDDLLLVLGAAGTQPGDPGYLAAADVNRDGNIDGADSQIVQDNFNGTCPR